LDALSGGRFRLGLGVSGPQVSEGWYGVPYDRPLGRTREYVEIVRTVLRREQLVYHGRHWTLPLPVGSGKPLRLMLRPPRQRIPIYLAALGPKNLELTGAIADGWLPFLLDPERPEVMLDPLRRGLERASRDVAGFDVAPVVPVALDADVDRARDEVRNWLAFYLGAMGARDKNFYVETAERYGHGAAAREVQTAMLDGNRGAAAQALTDGLIDCAAIACPPDALPSRLAAYAGAGATSLVAVPSGADKAAVVRALAAAAERMETGVAGG
jgi:F420-dependent oxidoreductase-like protein